MEQARTVKEALSAKLPGRKIVFSNRFAELEKELLEIDRQLKGIVSKDAQRPIVFSHPVYQYFARRYGLNGKSVHWEPDEMPAQAMWDQFRGLLAGHPARWMIWEGEPTADTVAGLKNLRIGCVVFDPCGNTPDQGDLLSVMRSNLANLKIIYGEQGSLANR